MTSADDVRRLTDLPSMLDRLMAPDASERLTALVNLSGAADADAVGVLRWTLERGPTDVVLDAALTLEELDLRRERELQTTSAAFVADPTYATALAVGDAAAAGLRNGLADPITAPVLAEQARTAYLSALAADHDQRHTIMQRLAHVELAAGRPHEALEILSQLLEEASPEAAMDIELMRDQAAFAARRFELMSLLPEDLGMLPMDDHHPVFTRLDLALERAAETDRRSRPILHDRRVGGSRLAAGAVSTGMFRLDPA